MYSGLGKAHKYDKRRTPDEPKSNMDTSWSPTGPNKALMTPTEAPNDPKMTPEQAKMTPRQLQRPSPDPSTDTCLSETQTQGATEQPANQTEIDELR